MVQSSEFRVQGSGSGVEQYRGRQCRGSTSRESSSSSGSSRGRCRSCASGSRTCPAGRPAERFVKQLDKAGSYLRLIDFVHHSTLGLRVIKNQERDLAGVADFEVGELGDEALVPGRVEEELRPKLVAGELRLAVGRDFWVWAQPLVVIALDDAVQVSGVEGFGLGLRGLRVSGWGGTWMITLRERSATSPRSSIRTPSAMYCFRVQTV